jgi:hypothetical protein
MLVKKPLRKRSLGRSRRKWKENFSMGDGEVVRIGAGWNWFRIPTEVVVVTNGFHYYCMSMQLFNWTYFYTVMNTYCDMTPKAGTVEPEETSIAKQRLGKHVPVATNM